MTHAYNQQIVQEWETIKHAQGFGRSWTAWLLGFEVFAFVPESLPSIEWLTDALQLTKYEADTFVRQEARLRYHHHKHALEFAIQHNNNSKAYKFIRGQEQKFLHDIPYTQHMPAVLCRGQKGAAQLRVAEPITLPPGAQVTFGTCSATVVSAQARELRITNVQGHLPTHATLTYPAHAYTTQTMSRVFRSYWSQFWLRDSHQDQIADNKWQDLFDHIADIIPQQPPVAIPYDDPKLWWSAIHRLKPHKAIGIDGWHAEELQLLTFPMVEDLTKVFAAAWHLGLSTQMMQARTLLFAKRDRPMSISDGRPITILGYMARLSSKMVSDQVLSLWASQWPPEISGGLPRRSARDLSLLQQAQIEMAKTHRTAWCGWTMDLVKAFNLIPRRVIRFIFCRLGLPTTTVDFWFLSLRRLTRVLQCGLTLGSPEVSTTGLPEGDSMSVVGMMALSYVFHCCIANPQVFPFAYADNWSFMSTSERASFRTMIRILNLIHDLRMQIDFDKSWCWATTKGLQQFWREASALIPRPDFQFKIKNHVHDLGCMISYNNQVVLGPLRDKIDNAIAKCNRLKKLNLSLDQRAEKIQIAIWPATFYGALGLTIGDKHFTNLRRAAASVLVGDHKHASSPVALHYLSPHIQDPLLYIVTDLLTTLRRLFSYNSKLAWQFIQLIRQFDGTVKGPATTLASYLSKLQWEITDQATLIGPGGLRVHLPYTSNKQIKKQARIAWDWHCHALIVHRKGVPLMPFDSHTTHKVLATLTDRQRRILALTLTSGWQSHGAIAQWHAQEDPSCPWCKEYDTHKHQLLHCTAFQSVRSKHPQAVEWLTHFPHLCWFPLPWHAEEMELVRQSMYLRVHTYHTNINCHINHGTTIYTDGSCDDPRDPYAARAAWAAITCDPPSEDMPARKFTVLATGHCPGAQTINRAELYAILVAAEEAHKASDEATIFFCTDSQFSLNIIRDIEDGRIEQSPHKRDHWDLIGRLISVWDPLRFVAYKIKSHQQLEHATNQKQLYDIYGNDLADQAAGKVRKQDLPEFDELCHTVRQHYQKQKHMFTKLLDYLLDIAQTRMHKIEDTASMPHASTSQHLNQEQSGRSHHQLQTHIQKLVQWHVQEPLFPHPPEPHPVVFWACSWGINWAKLVWQFSLQLRWPDPSATPAPQDPGISWTELAISFMLWAGRILPIKIQEVGYSQAMEYAHHKVQMQPVKKRSLRVMAENFRLIVKHLQTFSRTRIFPVYKKQGTASLTRLGFSAYHESGVSRRPHLPNAEATYKYLHELILQISHDPPFHNEIPPIDLPTSTEQVAWPDHVEIHPAKRDKFTQHVRYYMFRKKNFDDIQFPGPN